MATFNTNKLPDPNSGLDALIELGSVLGDEYVFQLYRSISLNRPGPGDAELSGAAYAQHQLAQRMLAKMRAEDPALDYDQARHKLADKLGYKPTSRTNFYKLLEGKRRPYKSTGGQA